MIVVSDTTPLISLLKIGRLDLLEKLFKAVDIPQAVFDELTDNAEFIEEAETIKSYGFVKVVPAKNLAAIEILQKVSGLDKGESEAIVLYKEKNSDLILLDELKARKVASAMELRVMGIVGILYAAFEKKLVSVSEIERFCETLKASRRFIDERLFESLIAKCKSEKN